MELHTFRTLLTSEGQAVLRKACDLQPRPENFLAHFQTLSRWYPPDLARAALETATLRLQAREKFPQAEQMYFTRPALEQASPCDVSTYRVQRYRAYQRVVDLGCSIGGDTLSLAAVAPCLGIDLDPVRLAMAQANLAALNQQDMVRFLQADLRHPLPVQPSPDLGLFFDPARRTGQQRIFHIGAYQPPLSIIWNWLSHYPSLGVKISPGVDLVDIRSYPAEIEFISLHGQLKEAALWFGPLATTRRRATILPGPFSLACEEPYPVHGSHDRISGGTALLLSEPRAVIYEPDPAILRAGLVQQLGIQLGAAQMDPDIAYLTADDYCPTPFARAWTVETWMPFGLKNLRAALRQRKVGKVTVKKRGSPLQPEDLIRGLRLKGDQQRVLFLTHLHGRPIVILAFGRLDNTE